MTNLKIKEGGYYRLRNGKIAGPARPSDSRAYPWLLPYQEDWSISLTDDGRYWTGGHVVDRDAIAEVTKDGEDIPKIEVGQRWRYVGNGGEYYTPNSTYRVISSKGSIFRLEDNNGSNSNSGRGHIWATNDAFFGKFELVKDDAKDEAPPAPERMTKRRLLETAIETVAGRGLNYGRPEDNFLRIARLWNVHLLNRHGEGFGGDTTVALPTLDAIDVALMMDLMKTARLENSPTHMDSWIDKAGYAACGGEIAGGANG